MRNIPTATRATAMKSSVTAFFLLPGIISSFTAIHGEAAEQVGEQCDWLAAVEHQALADLDADAPAQVLEVHDRAMVDVRRLVPLVGQGLRNGHAAERDLQPRAPVAKVREADDALAPDAQHL